MKMLIRTLAMIVFDDQLLKQITDDFDTISSHPQNYKVLFTVTVIVLLSFLQTI